MRSVGFRRAGFLGLATLLAACWVVGPLSQAQEDKEKSNGRKMLKDNAKKAEKVDFTAALGLELESLKTLGTRIETARRANDPVCLAALALELKAAEKVADKLAEIKGDTLMKQAVKMATYRNRPDELNTVAKLVDDKQDSQKLTAQADKTAKALKARAGGQIRERAKGITGYLIVRNYTRYYVTININYVDRGTVNPYSVGYTYVGDSAFSTTRLYAYAAGTTLFWGPRYVSEPVDNYTWNLYE